MAETRINEYATGASDDRPWGRWTVLSSGDGYVVKEIAVKPGEILSLQSHEHRAEHWIVLDGVAQVTIDDEVIERRANETAFIPVGARHRIANIGDTLMRFVEVQTGEVLSEDDIRRYEDRYGRSA
ncbi:MAG: phosphomannose isomerase type II C-terminal cupin domain [Pseudomonadota bacterium]